MRGDDRAIVLESTNRSARRATWSCRASWQRPGWTGSTDELVLTDALAEGGGDAGMWHRFRVAPLDVRICTQHRARCGRCRSRHARMSAEIPDTGRNGAPTRAS